MARKDFRLLILKMGGTLPALKSRRGDFEDWIIAGLGLPREKVSVVDVPRGEALPAVDGHAGIVITGSHAMITERNDWSERTAGWLGKAVARGTPVLGICYGHQLLAHALGGRVDNNPNGEELGAVEVTLEEPARGDPLLAGVQPRIRVFESHAQSVLKLPPGAVRLASNSWDANQSFRVGASAWGVQFHPEFDVDIVRAYVEHHRTELFAEGQDPERLLRSADGDVFSGALLRSFAGLVQAAS
jgi:GMP synthase (glutamine-hydrolysing)